MKPTLFTLIMLTIGVVGAVSIAFGFFLLPFANAHRRGEYFVVSLILAGSMMVAFSGLQLAGP